MEIITDDVKVILGSIGFLNSIATNLSAAGSGE